ncbi:MAG: GHKL domain-containing protein [Eubacterium sp.]|jgi:sensor histidine kinase YesM|nr:GHKL domain-containing protein [Eubacterium sp.]
MTNWVFWFSGLAAGIVRVFVCLIFIFRFLSVKKPGGKSAFAVLFGSVLISVVVYASGMPELYRIILEAVLVAACASRLQGADVRMSLFISIFYEIAVWFWQFLIAAWLGVAFHSLSFLDSKTGGGQTVVWLLHMILSVLAGCFLKSITITGKEAFRFAYFIALAGFFAVVTLSEQEAIVISDDTLRMWTVQSVVLMMAVLVFHMNRQYEVEKKLAKLKAEQEELLEREYTNLNRIYAVNAKVFHDLHNHIGILRQMLLHGKTEEAMQYLNELQTPVQKMADTVWTGDETLDYLINRKAVAAEEYGIDYQVEVEFPRHTNLRSADLCAILGNLLDNALEAAKQVQKPNQRFIRLTIRRINQMLVIKTENSFAVLPIVKDHALQTSKDKNGLHGWGLKSACAAAEKYDGMVQTSYTDCVFRAVATLSYQGVSIE